MEERLGWLEGCFLSIQEDLKKLVAGGKSAPAVPPSTNVKPPARPPAPKVGGPKLDGMDPSVVKAALDSGIELKHIEEMGRFVRSQGKDMGDEPRATIRAKVSRQSLAADDDLNDGDAEDEEANPVEATLKQI